MQEERERLLEKIEAQQDTLTEFLILRTFLSVGRLFLDGMKLILAVAIFKFLFNIRKVLSSTMEENLVFFLVDGVFILTVFLITLPLFRDQENYPLLTREEEKREVVDGKESEKRETIVWFIHFFLYLVYAFAILYFLCGLR